MNPPPNITINVTRIVRSLSLIIALLLCASITTFTLDELGIRTHAKGLFSIDAESNFPSYFSAIQLLLAAGLLSLIALLEWRTKSPMRVQWTVLALGFALMSVDEICSLHEKLIPPVRAMLHTSHEGLFHFAWVIPGIVVCIGLAIYFFKFLLSLPRATRRDFLIAASLFLGGAIGLEMIGGWWAELHGIKNLVYYIETHLEEFCEMIGILLFIRALLRYIGKNYGTLSVDIPIAPPQP